MPLGYVSIKCEFTNVFSFPFLATTFLMKDWLLQESGLSDEYKSKIVGVQVHEIGRRMEIIFDASVNCLKAMKQMSGTLFVKCSLVGFHYLEIMCKFEPFIDYVEELSWRDELKTKCGKYGIVLQIFSKISCEDLDEEEMRVILLTRLYSNQIPKYIKLEKADDDDESEQVQLVAVAEASTVQLDLSDLDSKVLDAKWKEILHSMFA